MSKYLTPEIEPNNLGLKLKNKTVFNDKVKTNEQTIKENPITENKKKEKKTIDKMIIPAQEKTKKLPEKIAKKRKKEPGKIQQIIDFLLLSGIIFVIIFLSVNFSAYKEITLNYFYPEHQQAKSENLKNAVGLKEVQQILVSVDNSKKHIKKNFPALDLAITPPDNRIIIPRIGKNIPLVEMDAENLKGENWKELEDQIQEGLRNGVVHYPGTAIPGQIGNVFITGHSSYYPWDNGQYKEVFALLPEMDVGDTYYVFYNQKKYEYKIREKKEVYPNNVDVLNQPSDKKVSTLMTCVPVGTALRRLIIVAEEV